MKCESQPATRWGGQHTGLVDRLSGISRNQKVRRVMVSLVDEMQQSRSATDSKIRSFRIPKVQWHFNPYTQQGLVKPRSGSLGSLGADKGCTKA